MRYFNTAGPCDPARHYMLPAQERLPTAVEYITEGNYLVVHAPRQTGKTTSTAALARDLTAEGTFLALNFSCEEAAAFGDNVDGAEQVVLSSIRRAAEQAGFPADLRPPEPWPSDVPGSQLGRGLSAWVAQCPRPLVLFFDEIDALRGDSLRSVLGQLRAGFTTSRDTFVHSVTLCGLRDVRDYKTASGGDPARLGGPSPFNIVIESLRIGDFTESEVAQLYGQHTVETGQEFTAEAVERAFRYTRGQPWLVNALAFEIIRRMRIAPPEIITAEHIDTAKERLILARATPLDSLVSKLHEPRVQRIIEPLIAGSLPDIDHTFNDDLAYVRDLGLIATDKPIRVANPIYREVIVRVLGAGTEEMIVAEPRTFKLPDGRLDLTRLLPEFAAFWIEHGEILDSGSGYHEVAPQLVLMAFLHHVVNGAGHIDREYGVGRGRIDLLIRQPYTDLDGNRAWQREAFELKVWRDKQTDPLDKGLGQLDSYLDRLGLATGVLSIFDRRTDAAPIPERTRLLTSTTPSGRAVTLRRA